ncbi:VWA domain-containing protein [Microtetraspora sp. NBRC 16547]|uniref:vWA domain-containing protein n=1 Tax=Microtetraspora sp. NBRC 16547 TaxID=3030993 RepID=UPI0024A33D7E|nr:VWA domain-containing protein [Microtetraspora sp. NBRC 16547]GLW97281.1 VWA domain-containing protein [Microtetraspora sp. NBRC 16547]
MPELRGGGTGDDRAALVSTLTGFARTLRAAGVAADHQRTQGFLAALRELDVRERRDVYWAGRLTLCSGPDDLDRYDRCFAAYFGGERPGPAHRVPAVTVTRFVARPGDTGDQDERHEADAAAATASEIEVLRHRDVARMTAAERREVARLLGMLRSAREQRRSRRRAPSHRGALDGRGTVREAVRRGGEPARLRFRDRKEKPRRVVMLVDVSGSMAAYADTLLRFAHALVRAEPRATEVFSVGTRLTRVTAELRHRDPAVAMDAVSAAIPDWSGGTRLGEELKELLRLSDVRGAIVVIASDGWERGDASLLGRQMERLSRLAHRVIWVNPHKGDPAYRPLTAGMRAALPHITDFVAGHSLAAYEELARLLGEGGSRPGGHAVRAAGDAVRAGDGIPAGDGRGMPDA